MIINIKFRSFMFNLFDLFLIFFFFSVPIFLRTRRRTRLQRVVLQTLKNESCRYYHRYWLSTYQVIWPVYTVSEWYGRFWVPRVEVDYVSNYVYCFIFPYVTLVVWFVSVHIVPHVLWYEMFMGLIWYYEYQLLKSKQLYCW